MNSQLKSAMNPLAAKDGAVVITSCLLEAFLACHTKCYLLSKGETGVGGDYTSWVAIQTESYRSEGKPKLTAEHQCELASGILESGRWKSTSWHFALDQIVRNQDWEASIQVVQRMPLDGTNLSAQLVPIRFVPANKLSNSDKMVAAFEALVLAKSLGVKVGVAKIIHGEKFSVFTVKANLFGSPP